MYRQQYPKLNDFSVDDISDVLRSRKLKRFEAAQKAKEDAENEAKEKAAEDAKADDDQKEEPEKQQQDNADDGNKKDDAANNADAAAKDDAEKEEEFNDKSDADDDGTKKEKESVSDRVLSVDEKKVIYALELLEDEYYGNEHALYLYVCSKYNVPPKEESLGVEAVDDRASSTVTDRLLESEQGLLCAECLEWKPFTMFSRNELENNGHFMACLKCEPDRDSVEHCKWNPEWKCDGIVLEDKNHVATIRQNGHRSAVVDPKRPAVRGLHCWRWNLKQHRTWALIGVSYPKVCVTRICPLESD